MKTASWNRLKKLHVCQFVRRGLSISRSIEKVRLTSNSQTWQSWLFLMRGNHWFFLHFTINLVEKRWLWVLRQMMMWFVTVDHQWAARIASTLHTWQKYLPQSSAFSWKINSRGSTDNLQRLRKYFLCQPHRSRANICIRHCHCSLQQDGERSMHQLPFKPSSV